MDRRILTAVLLGVSLLTVPSAVADDRDLSCTVDVGTSTPVEGAPGATAFLGSATVGPVSVDGLALGTCTLGTLETMSVVAATDIPDACHASADVDDDRTFEEHVEEGQTYPADTTFRMFCDAGVTDVTGVVDVDDAST